MSITTNRYENDLIKITCPIYVGLSHDTARSILEILRTKCEQQDRQEGSLRVQTATITRQQTEIEQRLKVDFFTLRHVLFNSMKTGVQLDLALRLQKEVGDEIVFIDDNLIDKALSNAVAHYKNYA